MFNVLILCITADKISINRALYLKVKYNSSVLICNVLAVLIENMYSIGTV